MFDPESGHPTSILNHIMHLNESSPTSWLARVTLLVALLMLPCLAHGLDNPPAAPGQQTDTYQGADDIDRRAAPTGAPGLVPSVSPEQFSLHCEPLISDTA